MGLRWLRLEEQLSLDAQTKQARTRLNQVASLFQGEVLNHSQFPLLSVEQLLQQAARLKVEPDEVCHVQFIVNFRESSFFCSLLLRLAAWGCISQVECECSFVDFANQIAFESI